MTNEIEIWKDVVGFEGIYEVSNLGQVRSLRRQDGIGRPGGGIIKGYVTKVGYKYVGIGRSGEPKRGRSLHRIVCTAFHENPDNKETVNHIDGDKSNNRADNLEWATWTENNRHARRTGLNVSARGEKIPWSKLTEADVVEIKKNLRDGIKSKTEIAEMFNVSRSSISLILRGKNWRHVVLPD